LFLNPLDNDTMKKTLLLFFFSSICSIHFLLAQAPSWVWARGEGGTGDDCTTGITTDAIGNVYVVGNFDSPTLTLGSTTLNNAGNWDVFLAKYDAAGNVLWAVGAGGTSRDECYGIVIDANDNVYIHGWFGSPSITFGATILLNTDFAGSEIFLVKYNSAGTVLWAKKQGGTGVDKGHDIAVDASGNVYATGFFQSSTITFGSTTLTNAGPMYTKDMYIVKYDSSGNAIWAKKAGGSQDDEGWSIAVDGSGNAFVCGQFTSPSLAFGSNILMNAGQYDLFIAKYDAAGNLQWGRGAGGIDFDVTLSVTTDANGNAYMTGWYTNDTITFGSIPLLNMGGEDIFLVKYTGTGNVAWAKRAGGVSYDEGRSIIADVDGNTYITGSFDGPSITFDTITLSSTNMNIFVVQYDSAGTALWAKNAGGAGLSQGFGICTDTDSNIYVTGYYLSSPIAFDTIVLADAGSDDDIFLAKLSYEQLSVSISDKAYYYKPFIYPNPTHDIFTISFNKELQIQNAELKIVDITGRVVNEQTLNSKHQTLNPNLSSGIYFVKVSDGERAYVEKVVVE
jgi:hypothetical protein